jgi:nitrogen fixation/metabolism regulation signal transduction histidine kinase
LRGSSAQKRGVVLVLEDLSELLAAQRVAAWSEVARRMAHEIKNPLNADSAFSGTHCQDLPSR